MDKLDKEALNSNYQGMDDLDKEALSHKHTWTVLNGYRTCTTCDRHEAYVRYGGKEIGQWEKC